MTQAQTSIARVLKKESEVLTLQRKRYDGRCRVPVSHSTLDWQYIFHCSHNELSDVFTFELQTSPRKLHAALGGEGMRRLPSGGLSH